MMFQIDSSSHVCFQAEEDRGSLGDDTAMNGLTVFCQPPGGDSNIFYGVIESFTGAWGYWRGLQYCGSNQYLSAFSVSVLIYILSVFFKNEYHKLE